jgi:hypothetical protein
MDFIERIFGIAPDGGSGTFEALVFMSVTLVLVGLMRWRHSVAASRHPRQ